MFWKILKVTIVALALGILVSIGLGVQTAYNTDTPVKVLLTDLKDNHYNPKKVMDHIKVTPQKKHYELLKSPSQLQKDQEHVYIVFKYGCPNCEAMTRYLYQKHPSLKNTEIPVSFINVESELGKNMVKDYKFEHVPTLIYAQHENQTNFAVFSITNDDGSLNTDLLEQYLRSAKNEKIK